MRKVVRSITITIHLKLHRGVRALLGVIVGSVTNEEVALSVCPRKIAHGIPHVLRRRAVHQRVGRVWIGRLAVRIVTVWHVVSFHRLVEQLFRAASVMLGWQACLELG